MAVVRLKSRGYAINHVETVIGQFVEPFKIQVIRARDNWHLTAKTAQKILAHTACFFINQSVNPDAPLQLEALA